MGLDYIVDFIVGAGGGVVEEELVVDLCDLGKSRSMGVDVVLEGYSAHLDVCEVVFVEVGGVGVDDIGY